MPLERTKLLYLCNGVSRCHSTTCTGAFPHKDCAPCNQETWCCPITNTHVHCEVVKEGIHHAPTSNKA